MCLDKKETLKEGKMTVQYALHRHTHLFQKKEEKITQKKERKKLRRGRIWHTCPPPLHSAERRFAETLFLRFWDDFFVFFWFCL